MTNLDRRNKYCFGLGTVGRDMFYSLESMYLLFFLTEVRQLDDAMLALVGGVLTVLRILDAFNDPITGVIIDNTHSRWGKFKPWILTGALVSAVCLLVLFHSPCATTLLTIRRETGSTAQTLLAVAVPSAVGLCFCLLLRAVGLLF